MDNEIFDELTQWLIEDITYIMDCWKNGRIAGETEDYDIFDDIDETFYDPYMGQDWYDCFGCPD